MIQLNPENKGNHKFKSSKSFRAKETSREPCDAVCQWKPTHCNTEFPRTRLAPSN